MAEIIPFIFGHPPGGDDADKAEAPIAYAKYQQGANSIPHLFTEKPEIHSTKEWYDLLTQKRELYESCRIVTLTWAKALASPLSHEFIQFIVEDSKTNTRTRVFAERQNQENPDRIIVGRDYATPENPSKQMDLPMPLKSLTFEVDKRPLVTQVAAVLYEITRRAPKYSMFKPELFKLRIIGDMCWWYAQSVFLTMRAYCGGELKEWQFSRYAYHMIIWNRLITDRKALEDEARRFKKQNAEGMSFQTPANAPVPLTTEGYLEEVSLTLQTDDALKEMEEALAIGGTEKVDPAALKEALQSVEASVTPPPKDAGRNASEAGLVFVEAMKKEPEHDENLQAYEQAQQRLAEEERTMHRKELFWGAGAQQKEDFAAAMESFVGGVLRALAESNANDASAAQSVGLAPEVSTNSLSFGPLLGPIGAPIAAIAGTALGPIGGLFESKLGADASVVEISEDGIPVDQSHR